MTIQLFFRLRSGLRSLLAAVLFASFCTLSLAAQSVGLGGIAGVVRDSSGAIVPGAAVTLTNSGTGASRTLTTNSEGFYQAQFLQPGIYELVLGGGAFGKVDRKNIPVTVGASVSVDVTLPLASVTTEVTVSSEAPLLDTEKVEQSQVINQNVVSNVPVNSRRFESFVLLTPNVVPDGTSGLISYRGINGTYNQNIVDGGNNNEAFFAEARGRASGAPFVFPVDAISQFESSATGYSAELGGAAGGIINAITKSGTNEWHGDAFEYYRTPGYNALDPYTKYGGRTLQAAGNPTAIFSLTQPVKVQHEFGVSVGGPILKDKLFFHFTYDGFRKVNPITYLSQYNLTGPTIANLVHLCDGGTTLLQDGTHIYPSTITGVSLAGCQAGVAALQNQEGSFARAAKQDIFFPRLDYQLNQKTHLSAEFLWQDFKEPDGYNGSTTITSGGVSNNGTANFHERFLIVSAETALSSQSANVVHFQWGRDLETDSTNAGGPYFSLSGIASLGETAALPRGKFPDEHRWQITDIYSHVIGHHSIKGGFDLNFIHEQIANLYQGDGQFSYTNTSTPEFNFANFIQDELGVNPTTGGAVRHYNGFKQIIDPLTGIGADDFWNQDIDGFVEDAWKVTPNLLVQIGLRYDVQLVPGPNLPNNLNPLATLYTSQINPDLKMFAPRIGFNWNVLPGTVVRGGYGMFYGLIGNSTYYDVRRENGVYQQAYTAGPTGAAPAPYVACGGATGVVCTQAGTNYNFSASGNGVVYPTANPVGGIPIATPPGPAPVNPVTGAAINIPSTISLAPVLGFYGLDPKFQNPVSHSVDLTVEQQLPLHSTFTIGYVGNRALRLPVYIDTNVDPTSATTAHTYQYTNPATGTVSNVNQLIYTNKLYTNQTYLLTGFSAIDSWYNSLVATVKTPMTHGVQLLANYTWAKAMDGGQTYGSNATFGGTDAPLNPVFLPGRNGINDEYARSDLDVRGRFVGTIVAKSQFSIPNKYVGYAVNGWLLGGTLTAQTGEPVTATISGSITAINGGQLGTLNSTGYDSGVTNAVYTSGPAARVPDWIAGRNAFKGPGIHNVDARISRSFPFWHEKSFEVAAEAFNVANHRNILSVNNQLVAYTAPGSTQNNGTTCPSTAVNAATVGCLGPLSASAAAFGSPASTSGVIYGARQVQLVGRFTF